METIELSTDSRGVATVNLNRPEKRNAMSGRMIRELDAAAAELSADGRARAVVIAGNGKTFCAGADLAWMKAQSAASAEDRMQEALNLARMLLAWHRCPIPVIARVHDGAYGGGVGLAAVADSVLASREARFGLTEARLGLVPATISPYVVAKTGPSVARRLFMTARVFSAEEAAAFGLVSAVCDLDELDRAVGEEADRYLSCAPGAIADAKALAQSYGPALDESSVAEHARRLVDRWDSSESAEGIAAFFEGRKPEWAAPPEA